VSELPQAGCRGYTGGYNDGVSPTHSSRSLATRTGLLLLFIGLLLVVRTSGGSYEDLLRRAERHAESGERSAAAAAYEALAGLRPGSAAPHLALAEIYLAWGRPADALEALSQAEGRGAKAAEVSRLRAFAHALRAERSVEERVSEWASAANDGERALALGASDLELRAVVARAHLMSRDWRGAAAIYEGILEADPGHALSHERLGALLMGVDPVARDHLVRAETDLSMRLLAALDGFDASQWAGGVHAAAGRILSEHGAWGTAVRHLELAVQDEPMDGQTQAYLGHALDQIGYRAEARRHLMEAVRMAPGLILPRTFLGLHYDRWGEVAAARREYESAYDIDPESGALCLEIGQTWAAEGRYVAAEIWLREAASLDPDDPVVWETLARFYLDHHIVSNNRAVEATERLLALTPDEARAHDLRGWAALQTGAYETAENHLGRALELDPHLASVHYHVGLLRDAQGRTDESERARQRAIDLDTKGVVRRQIDRSR